MSASVTDPHRNRDVSGESAATSPILSVADLTVRSAEHDLVRGASFEVWPGERVALIGESGSGKSLTSLSLMGLLPDGLSASGSAVLAGGTDLLAVGEKELAKLRGNNVSMVFQEPLTALNPTKQIGRQVEEAVRIHRRSLSRQARREAVLSILSEVRMPDPEAALNAYPHQLSGGQRQRVMIAMAMVNRPSLLICDEPTTALDVTVQSQILDLITSEVDRGRSALIFITHDLAVVSGICDRVLVMYGGTVVEMGTIEEVFTRPKHPYTWGLLRCSDLSDVPRGSRLPSIPGSVPPAGEFPPGCVFQNRCPRRTDECTDVPRLRGNAALQTACWNPIVAWEG